MGLFSTFLQVISFLQVKLASMKDNCKLCIPAFVKKFDRIWVEMAIKIKTSHVQNFFLELEKMQRTSKRSDLSEKKEWGHRAFNRVEHFSDIEIPTPPYLSEGRVLLGLLRNRNARLGINGICVLLGAIPFSEWTEYHSVHSAPDNRMNRMKGIRFTRNRQNTPESFLKFLARNPTRPPARVHT